jgi:glyoxalase family protein
MVGRGIHHLTMISAGAARTYDFYAHILGLRLVKQTVSYDEPGARLLYFGDGSGRPGTLINSLVWARVAPGTIGTGESIEVAFRIPTGSLGWWNERLFAKAVSHRIGKTAFGERSIRFKDPDGLPIGLIETPGAIHELAWITGDIDHRSAVRGLKEITLSVRRDDKTAEILSRVLGFARTAESDGCTRLVAHVGPGGAISLKQTESGNRGRLGAGTVSRIAFRARDADDLALVVEKLRSDYGIVVSDLKDMTYLKSVSFRAPCGALFEIATDGPGFEVDERLDELGSELKLPSFLEARRPELQAILPRLY